MSYGFLWHPLLLSKFLSHLYLETLKLTAASIDWKFYLCFTIPGSFFAAMILYYFPDTVGLPLEEINATF